MCAAAAIQAWLDSAAGQPVTQAHVAELLGEDRRAWGRYVRGEHSPSSARVAGWAETLGVVLEVGPEGWCVRSS